MTTETASKTPLTFKPMKQPPNAIQGLRHLRRMSLTELAREIGATAPQISRVERKGTGLGKAKWNLLAEFFGVHPWELHDPTLPERIASTASFFVSGDSKSVDEQ